MRTKTLVSTAAGVLLITALSACSTPEGADAPADASKEDFCAAMTGIDLGGSARELSTKLAEAGTPKGIPAEARAGFEVMIDEASSDELGDGAQAKVTALIAYTGKVCGELPETSQ